MKEGRLLIGQRGVSNSMLYPAILSSSLSSKCSVQILWILWCSAVTFIFDIEIVLIIMRKYCRLLPNKFFPWLGQDIRCQRRYFRQFFSPEIVGSSSWCLLVHNLYQQQSYLGNNFDLLKMRKNLKLIFGSWNRHIWSVFGVNFDHQMTYGWIPTKNCENFHLEKNNLQSSNCVKFQGKL